MRQPDDTIAALATPAGRGGVGILRVSGPRCAEVAKAVVGKLPAPRQAEYLSFRDDSGASIDNGIALFFPGPHSFTGEDVLELHGHGGPIVLDMLLRRVLSLGVRPARPGEFSERAFLNDKIDLAQAEAIADLIEAGSEQAARSAMHSLQGVFSESVHTLVEVLIELRQYVEAALDFPEEEIDFLADERIAGRLARLREDLAALLASAEQGCLLREGLHIVLAGRPNVGKSSLLNALAGRESAIVTEIPGTTRDVLREEIHVDGLPLHIIDTAGLRNSGDRIEQEGMRRAWTELAQADRVLLIVEDSTGPGKAEAEILARLPRGLPVSTVRNKIDLSGSSSGVLETASGTEIRLSVKQGSGLEALRDHLKASAGFQNTGEGQFMARRRHLEALEEAQDWLDRAAQQLGQHASELLAEDLRQAQQALNSITGEFSNEDLLGRIFSSFCIGK